MELNPPPAGGNCPAMVQEVLPPRLHRAVNVRDGEQTQLVPSSSGFSRETGGEAGISAATASKPGPQTHH